MGEISKIPWTDATFNGWIGCTHVNELCENCYAEMQNAYRIWNGTGTWGPGTPRTLTSESYWRQPFTWDRKAQISGVPMKVFAFSLADVFDADGPLWPVDRRVSEPVKHRAKQKDTPYSQAVDVFFREIVAKTPHLTWIVLTKRYERAAAYYKALWGNDPWRNVWVVFSAGTQKTVDTAMLHLKQIDAVVRAISAEPLLGSVDWREHLPYIDWLIAGGESGHGAREMQASWERTSREQARAFGVAYFLKQLGSRWLGEHWNHKWEDTGKWPAPLRVQEFPIPREYQHGERLERAHQ